MSETTATPSGQIVVTKSSTWVELISDFGKGMADGIIKTVIDTPLNKLGVQATLPPQMNEFVQGCGKGITAGLVSTVIIQPLDKMGLAATLLDNFKPQSFQQIAKQMVNGEFAEIYAKSFWVRSFRLFMENPAAGMGTAAVFACAKKTTFFWVNAEIQKIIYALTGNIDLAMKYSGFLAPLVTTFLTFPLALRKTRRMAGTNEDAIKISLKNLRQYSFWVNNLRGYRETAIRDSLNMGVMLWMFSYLRERFGDTLWVGAVGGTAGYIISNPFNVATQNKKNMDMAISMRAMFGMVYAKKGIAGFYPLPALALLRMVLYGMIMKAVMDLFPSDLAQAKPEEAETCAPDETDISNNRMRMR